MTARKFKRHIFQVHRNYPPLPPSPSAAVIPKAKSVREWLTSIKTIFTNKAFIIIFIFLGACMGCVSSVMTKIEQIMCSRGYSDQLSGLAGAMILTSAAVASLPINLLAYKSGRFVRKAHAMHSPQFFSLSKPFHELFCSDPKIALSSPFLQIQLGLQAVHRSRAVWRDRQRLLHAVARPRSLHRCQLRPHGRIRSRSLCCGLRTRCRVHLSC